MFEQSRKNKAAWVPAFLAVAGVTFSTLQALGKADVLCITTGCELFKTISIQGYSLWWAGTLFFSFMLLLCLTGRRGPALAVAGLALFIDTLLLVFMAFTAPCFSCLVVAVLIALTFVTLYRDNGTRNRKPSILLIVWLFAFCPNVFGTMNETMGTWAIAGPEQPDMQIFFSPSCPVCLATIERFAANPDAHIAFFPVAEQENDVKTIARISAYMDEGTSFFVAFKRAVRDTSSVNASPSLSLRWDLFRNKARLGTLGVTKIPVLITNGVPQSLLAPAQQPAAAFTPAPDASQQYPAMQPTMPNIDQFAGCGGETAPPCPDQAPAN
ncbi:MAG: hypothetical protein ACK5JO_15985 [Halodesulfovibrio sp.]